MNKELTKVCTSISVSLRNHGNSDWHKSNTYSEMANDVIWFLDEHGI